MGASRERIILTTAAGLAFVGLASLGLSFANGTSTVSTTNNAAISADTTTIVAVATVVQSTQAPVPGTPAESVTNSPTTTLTIPSAPPTRPSVPPTRPSVPPTTLPTDSPGTQEGGNQTNNPTPAVTAASTSSQPPATSAQIDPPACNKKATPGPWAVVLDPTNTYSGSVASYSDPGDCRQSKLTAKLGTLEVVGIYLNIDVACTFKKNDHGAPLDENGDPKYHVVKIVYDLSSGVPYYNCPKDP